MYELPQNPSIYRMLQADELILNASTRQITKEEQYSIQKYFSHVNNKKYEKYKNKIVKEGSFYHKLFIQSEFNSFIFDFDTKQFTFPNKQSYDYFQITDNSNVSGKYFNIYEQCEYMKQIIINFNHKKYSDITIHLNYFSNPQIKYGLSLQLERVSNITGLLIQEYNISKMVLKRLKDTRQCKCKKHKNSIKTKLLLLKSN